MQTRASRAADRRSFPSKGTGRASAFTLTELLLIISIIAVLTSLLTSALNKTKARGHQITCLNNLRQLQVSWFLYSDDNEEQLALNRSESPMSSPPLLPIMGKRNSTNSWVVGNPKEDATTDNLKRGTLFPYVKSEAVYRCPSDFSTVFGLGKSKVRRTRSYSISSYMNGDAAGHNPRVKTRYSDLVSPSPDQIFVFIEEHKDTPWNGSFAVLPKVNTISLNAMVNEESTPSDRHFRGCGLSFADGHVEKWRWLAPKGFNLPSKHSVPERKDSARLQKAIPDP